MANVRKLWLILNGKAAANPQLREALDSFRSEGLQLEVRVTWEGGDAARYAKEGMQNDSSVIIAGGGDGTINEVINGMMAISTNPQTAFGVLPFGTANDFATSCQIPVGDPLTALELLIHNEPTLIDVGKVNEQYFVNLATGGFGAQVTAATPPEMKKAVGGVAYSLMALVTAAQMSPYVAKLVGPKGTISEGPMIISAIGNGRQAGGGIVLCPNAKLNDGLLDVTTVYDVPVLEIGVLLQEIPQPENPDNRFVQFRQLDAFEMIADQEIPMNLDGEPIQAKRFEFSVVPSCLPFISPPMNPLL